MIDSSTPNFPTRRPPLKSTTSETLRFADYSPIMKADERKTLKTPPRSPGRLKVRTPPRSPSRNKVSYYNKTSSSVNTPSKAYLKKSHLENSIPPLWDINKGLEDEDSDQQESQRYEEINSSQKKTNIDDKSENKQEDNEQIVIVKGDGKNWFWYVIILAVLGFAFALIPGINQNSNIEKNPLTINELKMKFPNQLPNLWLALETSIKETKSLEKPWTIMLLYDSFGEETLKKLLEEIITYTTCNLQDCNTEAIILTKNDLNSPKYIKDYGVFIADIKPKLEEKGVLIIKNLENISEVTSQAFHTICDEYTPLVKRAIIIFTYKIDNSDEDTLNVIEDQLRSKWENIDNDIFDPLFTRITSTVIKIKPEF